MYPAYAWLCWRASRRFSQTARIQVVTTNPFFAPSIVARAAQGKNLVVNLLYDLFPEALIAGGKLRANSWLARRCAAVTDFALRSCAATVFLGERLRVHTENTHGPARRGLVIPVGADGHPFRNAHPERTARGIRTRLLYSGHFGRMHDSKTVADLLQQGSRLGVTWTFQASGPGYERLRAALGTQTDIAWSQNLPNETWQDSMKNAHVALVTIAQGAERVVMPSKTYSALVAGQAILAICPRASDLADLVFRHDCGWVIEPGDVAGLQQVVQRMAGNPEELWLKRRNAFEAGHRYYDMTFVAEKWIKLFEELTASPQPELVLKGQE